MERRTLAEVLENPSFRLDLMENVFQLFVAMGTECDHRVLAQAKDRLFFGVKDLPQISELVPHFVGFLETRIPLTGLTDDERKNAIHLLHYAQRGAGLWNREFLRFAQMQALLLAHMHRLMKGVGS